MFRLQAISSFHISVPLISRIPEADAGGWEWIVRYVGASGWVPTFIRLVMRVVIPTKTSVFFCVMERIGAQRLFAVDRR